MSKNQNQIRQSGGGGISFMSLLTIVFIVLKLCSVIKWSWWWVLAPMWIPALFFIVILIIAIILN